MNNLFLLSLILGSYIIYMLNYFKTTINFAHPLTYFNNKYLYHPIMNTEEKTSMICKLGNDGSWLIGLFLVLRFYLLKKDIIKTYSILVYLIVVSLSFLNFNALLYLIPYFLIEFYIIRNL
jgi:hypothetical protein